MNPQPRLQIEDILEPHMWQGFERFAKYTCQWDMFNQATSAETVPPISNYQGLNEILESSRHGATTILPLGGIWSVVPVEHEQDCQHHFGLTPQSKTTIEDAMLDSGVSMGSAVGSGSGYEPEGKSRPGRKVKTRKDFQADELKKMFECGHCERVFPLKNTRNRHIRGCKDERPFACGHAGCKSRFSREDNKTRHQRAVHGYAEDQKGKGGARRLTALLSD